MQTIAALISESFKKHSGKPALSFFRQGKIETEMAYGDLDRDSNLLAGFFRGLGAKRGDRIIFSVEKSLFQVVAHVAALRMGAVGVPLNPGFKKPELTYLLNDAQAQLVIAGPAQQRTIQEIDPEAKILAVDSEVPYHTLSFFRNAPGGESCGSTAPEDPGLIIYTSGTTGKPKGAVLTQGNLAHDAANIIEAWEIGASDVLCHSLPLFHVHGLCFALHTALISGAHVLMLDSFSPDHVLRLLSQTEGPCRSTVFMAVPSMYSRLLDALGARSLDFSHIRMWASGSAPLLVRDFERMTKAFGKEPVEREGMTETGMNFSNPLRGKRKPGSIGIPLPGLLVRIVHPDTGRDVPAGENGEIWLKSPSVTPGYWRKPGETAAAFVEGWFRTGDLGRMDEEGYYFLTDRLKHIIISGGENISPKEVESVINSYEGVAESSVVGVPDERWGEKVAAAVVSKPQAQVNVQELQAHCKEHLHSWKCPKEFILIGSLPRNAMGKILKNEVKKLFTPG